VKPFTEEKNPEAQENWAKTWLSGEDVRHDLDALEHRVLNYHPYFDLFGERFPTALEEMRTQFATGGARGDFVLGLDALLSTLTDGHTDLASDQLALSVPGSRLPFRLERASERFVAVHADMRLLEVAYPFVNAIDGIPLERWLALSRPLATFGGSARQILSSGVRLWALGYYRHQLGLEDSASVHVELEAVNGTTKTLELPVVTEAVERKRSEAERSRVLNGGVGYLNIQSMRDEPEEVQALVASMHDLKDTRALVIDVRGNGGGTRHALQALFPFFMRRDDPPRVYTTAVLRIPEGESRDDPQGYLADRFLHPITSSLWGAAERAAIEAFSAGFRPQWQPPRSRFSDWHYALVRSSDAPFSYSGRIAVLMDVRCASATDIFLGAFKGWRNTTLVGTNSTGSSGRPRLVNLERSGVRLRMSSMASFRPDGFLYERLGIQPDLEVPLRVSDLALETDTALEAALQVLLQ
jgi:Peptidase family S41